MKTLATFAFLTCFLPSFLSIRLDFGADRSNLVGQPSGNEAIRAVMDTLSKNFTTASDLAISQLTSVLMLKNSSSVVDGLRTKIDIFRSGLLDRLETDLSESAMQFNAERGSGPLTDDQKYQFSEMVQEKWEETLSSELSIFQQSVLPQWINSVKNVWKGIERLVIEKIQKFKKFMRKFLPAAPSTCQRPKSNFMNGFNSVDTFGRHGISKRLGDKTFIALLTVTIASGIAMALLAPFGLALIGVLILLDVAACLATDWLYEDEEIPPYPYDDEELERRENQFDP